jgi:hypothetical protein
LASPPCPLRFALRPALPIQRLNDLLMCSRHFENVLAKTFTKFFVAFAARLNVERYKYIPQPGVDTIAQIVFASLA